MFLSACEKLPGRSARVVQQLLLNTVVCSSSYNVTIIILSVLPIITVFGCLLLQFECPWAQLHRLYSRGSGGRLEDLIIMILNFRSEFCTNVNCA